MREEARAYPDVELILGAHLGFDELLVDLLIKRMEESQHLGDIRSGKT